jgi:hypothetical protein
MPGLAVVGPAAAPPSLQPLPACPHSILRPQNTHPIPLRPQVLQQLGKGKYGEVFEGVDLDTEARCVVKIMRPVKEQRLKREIKILRHVRGGPNIIGLVDLVRDPDTKTPCFVFELVDAVPLRELQVGGVCVAVDVCCSWGGEGL